MKEYEILIGVINRLGTSAITIKGWTTTLVVAAISLKKGDLSGELTSILILAIAGLWFVEITFRQVSASFKLRCVDIEQHFADTSSASGITSPAINAARWRAKGFHSLFRIAFHIRVFPMYLILLIGVVALYVYTI
jgi:hypothetical protein